MELQHHGVKGMRWGVRRYRNPDGSLTAAGKKHEYGYSKRQLKKEFRKAAKENNPGFIPMTTSSTGKHVNEVNKRYLDEVSKATKNLMKEYNSKFATDDVPEDIDAYDKDFDRWSSKYNSVVGPIAKRYVQEFNDARLKDINYSDVERGRRMLKDYDLDWQASPNGIRWHNQYRANRR